MKIWRYEADKRQWIGQKKKLIRDLLGIKFVTLHSKTSFHTLQTQVVAITWGYFSDFFFHSAWTHKKGFTQVSNKEALLHTTSLFQSVQVFSNHPITPLF